MDNEDFTASMAQARVEMDWADAPVFHDGQHLDCEACA